ncbi:MAG: HNH endonuclease [Algicola sp.]|nr:HNH endonuclease [Algicola sp.]
MTPDELKKAVLGVKRWSRGDQRAPNKPLMMVYALARYIQGHDQMFSYEHEVEQDVTALLKRFGPSRKAYQARYPFWRLLNDGIWRLDNAQSFMPYKDNADPPKSLLIANDVTGGFSDEAYKLIIKDTAFAIELLESILVESFPDSIIPEITAHLGLEFTYKHLQKRDPKFRREVLRAYNYKCAVCGFDMRMDDMAVGLEAAHIKWKQFNGPCDVQNGLSLCSLHHKMFDKGAFGITDDFKIRISPAVNGGDWVKKLLFDYEGSMIVLPREKQVQPSASFLDWHHSEVVLSACTSHL